MSQAGGRVRKRDRAGAARLDEQGYQRRGRSGRREKKKASRKRKRPAEPDEPLWESEKPEDAEEEEPELEDAEEEEPETGEGPEPSDFPPASTDIGSWIPWPEEGPGGPAGGPSPPSFPLMGSAASSSSPASHVWVVCDLLSSWGGAVVELEPHESSDYILKRIQGRWLPCRRMLRSEAVRFTDSVCERIGCPRGVPRAIPDEEADHAEADGGGPEEGGDASRPAARRGRGSVVLRARSLAAAPG